MSNCVPCQHAQVTDRSQVTDRADLKSLSLVSKYVHAVVAPLLWRSLTLQAREPGETRKINSDGLATMPCIHTKELCFNSSFERAGHSRCLHRFVRRPNSTSKTKLPFVQLAEQVTAVLSCLEKGALSSQHSVAVK